MTIDALTDRLPPTVGLRAVAYEAGRAPEWLDWLSAEERACLDTFGAESRRREFLAGRAAARGLLAGRLRVGPGQVPLRRADDGAVDVVGGEWRVSIAHSGARAVAACAHHPVGVDLERIQARDPAVADFLFAPAERDWPDRLPYAPDAALVLCWALKEAVLKARRSGFRVSPKALRLAVEPSSERAHIRVEGGTEWELAYARLDGFWAVVAVPAPDDRRPAG
jgi:4'-phosphopantetheinyl transferase